MISSVYITCVKANPFSLALAPHMLPELSSLLSNLDSTSRPRINRYGTNGLPCLSPLLGLNRFDLPSLTSNLKDTDEMHVSIRLMNTESNPRLASTTWMNLQLNQSYAF